MGGGDIRCIGLLSDFFEKLVPQIPGSFLLREMSVSHVSEGVDSFAVEWNIELFGSLLNKCFVTVRLVAPELVIDMCHCQAQIPFDPARREKMQQDHGIDSATDCNNNSVAWHNKSGELHMMRELVCQYMVMLVHDRL